MSDIELPDHNAGWQPSIGQYVYTADQLRAAILADREKRAQAAQPVRVGTIAHIGGGKATLTAAIATTLRDAGKPVQACDHQYHYFGDQQKRRRCNHCNELEPVQAEAPTASNEEEPAETPESLSADAYDHACDEMERWQRERRLAGKEVGTTGSLCDGIAWLYGYINDLEAALATQQEAQPQAEPLTDDFIDATARKHFGVANGEYFQEPSDRRREFARAIERAARAAQQATGERG